MGYYILYGFLWVGGLLPLRILYFFSDIYFYLIYYLLKYRRRVVRANLQHAFPEKDLSERLKNDITGICVIFLWKCTRCGICRMNKYAEGVSLRILKWFGGISIRVKVLSGYWGITAIGNGCLPIAFGCPGNSTSLPYINLCIMR